MLCRLSLLFVNSKSVVILKSIRGSWAYIWHVRGMIVCARLHAYLVVCVDHEHTRLGRFCTFFSHNLKVHFFNLNLTCFNLFVGRMNTVAATLWLCGTAILQQCLCATQGKGSICYQLISLVRVTIYTHNYSGGKLCT